MSLIVDSPPDVEKRLKEAAARQDVPAESSLQNKFDALRQRIQNFAALGENWNGYRVAAPDPAAIARAEHWIASLYLPALTHGWLEPFVSPDEDGAIVFEWQRGERWLSVTVAADAATYLREGTWPAGESETGGADTPDEQEALWKWLMA